MNRRIATTAAATLLMLGLTGPAWADGTAQSFTLSYTGGQGAYPRSAPEIDARTGTAFGEGSPIDVDCFLDGESVTNVDGYTSSLWVRSDQGQYWPEAWLDTAMAGIPPGVPACVTTDTAPDGSTLPNGFFDRGATTRWALDHAMDSPPLNEALVPGCTWFVSQALWAGNFPQDDDWTSSGHHSKLRVRGSVTAWSADNLFRYLQEHFDVWSADMDFTSNVVPNAEVGDVVAYDWDDDGTINHLSLITNITADGYPEVSEWGTNEWNDLPNVNTQYQKRGWTWSEKHHAWLQDQNPQVRATLLHFNGGTSLPTF